MVSAVACGLALTGCVSTTSPGGGSTKTSSITVALPTEPSDTDPIMTRSIGSWNIYYALYDGLTRITASGKIEPGLATSWTHNKDSTVWDFDIRKDVTFQNGDPLKASDIVYTYQKILDSPKSTNRVAIAMVQSVTEVKPGVVEFVLKSPFSAWLNQVATIGIVPQSVYEKDGSDFENHPVGTGPYSFVSWKHGVSYQLTRNDKYWGTKPSIKDVTISFVGDTNARLTGVQSGTLDIAPISADQITSLSGSSQAKAVSEPSNQVMQIGINTTAGVLANQDVRQAISLAIDRDSLIKNLLGGKGVANGELVAKGVQGFVPDFPAPEYDPDRAKQLLSQAGYKGEEITFDFASTGGDPMSPDLAQAVQGYLQKVGLKVRLIGQQQTSLSLKIANHQITGLYLQGWAPSSMDGDVVVSQLLAGGPEDYPHDPKMTQLYTQQQSAAADARAAVFEQIWTQNAQEAYHLPLYTGHYSYAVNSSLTWTPAADGIYRLTDISSK
ncbi:hypothetical protein A6A27_24685 [Micromonospora sp. CB01531]|nr:hypothetical protein A6A27_24685 [Micromonospora sp. CB01531]